MSSAKFKREKLSTPFDNVSVSVDLDGFWAIKKCYNLDEGSSFFSDPVYEEGLIKFAEIFKTYDIFADFFVVGRDMELDWKTNLVRALLRNGHDVGNHSYHHILGLTLLEEDTLRTEILASQAILKAVMGHWPLKFRSPGYDLNGKLLKILIEYHIKYDYSLFPTPWGFVMRFMDGYMRRWKGVRKSQYGTYMNLFAPLRPYYPSFNHAYLKGKQDKIIEIPVSVTPVLRFPMHFGIILNMGEKYFVRALNNFRRFGLPIHFVFHGIDFVDTTINPIFKDKSKNNLFGPPIDEKYKIAHNILNHLKKFDEQ